MAGKALKVHSFPHRGLWQILVSSQQDCSYTLGVTRLLHRATCYSSTSLEGLTPTEPPRSTQGLLPHCGLFHCHFHHTELPGTSIVPTGFPSRILFLLGTELFVRPMGQFTNPRNSVEASSPAFVLACLGRNSRTQRRVPSIKAEHPELGSWYPCLAKTPALDSCVQAGLNKQSPGAGWV